MRISNEQSPEYKHKQQSLLWIFLPLALIILLILSAGVFVIMSTSSGDSVTQTWSAISLVFLLLPMAILSIIPLIILVLAVVGMSKAGKALPPYLRKARHKVLQLNGKAQAVTDKAASPMISIRSFTAGAKALLGIFRRSR